MANFAVPPSSAVCRDIPSRAYPVLADIGQAPPNPRIARLFRPIAADAIAGATRIEAAGEGAAGGGCFTPSINQKLSKGAF